MTIFIIIGIVIFIFIVLLSISWYGLPNFGKKDNYIPPTEDQINEEAKPFKLGDEKGKTCIICVHGFEGSPFTFKNLAEELYYQGYSVIVPLLPGHGTNIDELLKTDFDDWFKHIENIYTTEYKNYENIYIIGLSLGGLITLKLAEKYCNTNYEPTGIVSIAAPMLFVGYYNGEIILADIRVFFTGIIKYFVKKIKRKKIDNEYDFAPWVGYDDYLSIPGVHSIKIQMAKVRHKLKKIICPSLLIQAMNDKTIPQENLHYVFNKIRSPEKMAYMVQIKNENTTNHILTTHIEVKDRIFYSISKFIENCNSGFIVIDKLKKERHLTRLIRYPLNWIKNKFK